MPFVDVLADRLAKMKAGSGFADGVSIGPLIDADAMERMQRQVDDAVKKGAVIETRRNATDR